MHGCMAVQACGCDETPHVSMMVLVEIVVVFVVGVACFDVKCFNPVCGNADAGNGVAGVGGRCPLRCVCCLVTVSL